MRSRTRFSSALHQRCSKHFPEALKTTENKNEMTPHVSLFQRAGVKRKRKEAATTCSEAPKEFWSVNSELQDVFEVLKFEYKKNPELLGASTFGYEDFHQRYWQFVTSVRKEHSARSLGGKKLLLPEKVVPEVFGASCDVSKCFDTINKQKLVQIVSKVV